MIHILIHVSMITAASHYEFLSLQSPGPIRLVVHHILVGVASPEVWNPPVVIVSEVCASSTAQVSDVVRSLLGLEIPVKLSSNEWTLCSLVPVV